MLISGMSTDKPYWVRWAEFRLSPCYLAGITSPPARRFVLIRPGAGVLMRTIVRSPGRSALGEQAHREVFQGVVEV